MRAGQKPRIAALALEQRLERDHRVESQLVCRAAPLNPAIQPACARHSVCPADRGLGGQNAKETAPHLASPAARLTGQTTWNSRCGRKNKEPKPAHRGSTYELYV